MKNIFLIVTFFGVLTATAQPFIIDNRPVKSLYDDNPDIAGAYYKDKYNDLDKFTGTWVYTNGNTSLTIKLVKKTNQYNNNRYLPYYEDVLVGEYKYIENGVEKINTLSQLQLNLPNTYDYNIFGNTIIGPGILCKGCTPNERRISLGFIDPNRDIIGYEPQMIFSRVDVGNTKRLKLNFRTISGYIVYNGQEPQYTQYTIPFGEYILTKID